MLGEKFKQKVNDAFRDLLDRHLETMKEAYLKSEAGLSVSIPIKIQPSQKKEGCIDVAVGIRFVRLRTKEVINFEINEAQDPLIRAAVERLRPKKGSGIDSIKITDQASGASVELRAKE